jgi:hypothetical protein
MRVRWFLALMAVGAVCVYASALGAGPNDGGATAGQPSSTTRPAAIPQAIPQALPPAFPQPMPQMPDRSNPEVQAMAERIRQLQWEVATLQQYLEEREANVGSLWAIRPGPGPHTFPGFRPDYRPRPDTGVGPRVSPVRTPRPPRHVFGPVNPANAPPATGPVVSNGSNGQAGRPDYQ